MYKDIECHLNVAGELRRSTNDGPGSRLDWSALRSLQAIA